MSMVRECDVPGCHSEAKGCEYKNFYRASFQIQIDLCVEHLDRLKRELKREAGRHDDETVSIFNKLGLGDRWTKRGR